MPTTLLCAARFCGLRACVFRCPLLLSAATVHVGVKQRVDDFSKYLYLTRVKNAQVILDAIQDGVARLTWKHDTFAYPDSHDSAANRYRGLETGRRPNVQLNSESVVVKPDVASVQIEKEAASQARLLLKPMLMAGHARLGLRSRVESQQKFRLPNLRSGYHPADFRDGSTVQLL